MARDFAARLRVIVLSGGKYSIILCIVVLSVYLSWRGEHLVEQFR